MPLPVHVPPVSHADAEEPGPGDRGFGILVEVLHRVGHIILYVVVPLAVDVVGTQQGVADEAGAATYLYESVFEDMLE